MMHDRHWTVDEANAMIPYVAERLRRLRAARDRMIQEGAPASIGSLATVTGGAWPGRDRAEAGLELTLGMRELEGHGIVVRDLDAGLIDFPALRDGEEVYLCWLLDEPAVSHWHAIEAGFRGRRPL
jgi:Uncharacterized conserved protein (DUF2203)